MYSCESFAPLVGSICRAGSTVESGCCQKSPPEVSSGNLTSNLLMRSFISEEQELELGEAKQGLHVCLMARKAGEERTEPEPTAECWDGIERGARWNLSRIAVWRPDLEPRPHLGRGVGTEAQQGRDGIWDPKPRSQCPATVLTALLCLLVSINLQNPGFPFVRCILCRLHTQPSLAPLPHPFLHRSSRLAVSHLLSSQLLRLLPTREVLQCLPFRVLCFSSLFCSVW